MRKSKRFLFIALAVTLMLSACVKTEQDSSSGDNTSNPIGDISSSQIDEISSSQSENGTSSSGASSQTEYAPAISETYEKYNDLSFMPPEAKKVYEENGSLLEMMLGSPTEVVFSGEYEWLLDADGNYHRLIHEKTGFSYYDKYFWNQAPNSRRLKEKADYIKSKGKWALVREQYKRIKNKYLTSNDYNHSSFICYIEAVNNVYNSRKHWD